MDSSGHGKGVGKEINYSLYAELKVVRVECPFLRVPAIKYSL